MYHCLIDSFNDGFTESIMRSCSNIIHKVQQINKSNRLYLERLHWTWKDHQWYQDVYISLKEENLMIKNICLLSCQMNINIKPLNPCIHFWCSKSFSIVRQVATQESQQEPKAENYSNADRSVQLIILLCCYFISNTKSD